MKCKLVRQDAYRGAQIRVTSLGEQRDESFSRRGTSLGIPGDHGWVTTFAAGGLTRVLVKYIRQ